MNPNEAAPKVAAKNKVRTLLEYSGAIAAILGAIAAAAIWMFQTVSDAAVRRAVLPMQLERIEKTTSDHEARITSVETKAVVSQADREQLHREIAESRGAFTSQLSALANDLSKRLDRLDERTERIGDRVGVARQMTPDPKR